MDDLFGMLDTMKTMTGIEEEKRNAIIEKIHAKAVERADGEGSYQWVKGSLKEMRKAIADIDRVVNEGLDKDGKLKSIRSLLEEKANTIVVAKKTGEEMSQKDYEKLKNEAMDEIRATIDLFNEDIKSLKAKYSDANIGFNNKLKMPDNRSGPVSEIRSKMWIKNELKRTTMESATGYMEQINNEFTLLANDIEKIEAEDKNQVEDFNRLTRYLKKGITYTRTRKLHENIKTFLASASS